MRELTQVEREAIETERRRCETWARWQSGEIKPHPSIGVVCPWCGADFCEVDDHVARVHNR